MANLGQITYSHHTQNVSDSDVMGRTLLAMCGSSEKATDIEVSSRLLSHDAETNTLKIQRSGIGAILFVLARRSELIGRNFRSY